MTRKEKIPKELNCKIALHQSIIDHVWDKYVEKPNRNKGEVAQLSTALRQFAEENKAIIGDHLHAKYHSDHVHERTLTYALSRDIPGLGAMPDLRDLLCYYAFHPEGQNWEKTLPKLGSDPAAELESSKKLQLEAAQKKIEEQTKGLKTANLEISTDHVSNTVSAISVTENEPSVHKSILILNDAYWNKVLQTAQANYKDIDINFRLYAEEYLTDHYVAMQAQLNPSYCQDIEDLFLDATTNSITVPKTVDEVVQNALGRFLPTLIKIFAPSGEGKTVFLRKIGYYYSRNSGNVSVVRLKNVSEEILISLGEYVRDSVLPVIVMIDSPYLFEAALKTHLFDLRTLIIGKKVVFIIADQGLRYDSYLLKADAGEQKFDSFFSLVETLAYALPNDEKHRLFSGATLLFSKQNPDISPPVVVADLYDERKTLRELLWILTNHAHGQTSCKHEHDWEIYGRITVKKEYAQLRPLFALVSVFAICEIRMPLSLLDEGYLDGVTSFTVIELLRRSPNGVLRIDEGNTLHLRHEEVPRWYFKQSENQDYGLRALDVFIEKFEQKLDSIGCYLFRNIIIPVRKTFLTVKMPTIRVRGVLQSYMDKRWSEGSQDTVFAKVMLRLSKLEAEPNKQIGWLEKIIKNYPDDFRARTKLAEVLFDIGRTGEAQSIYDRLIADNVYDTYVFELEQKLLTGKGYFKSIKPLLRKKADLIPICLDIAKKKIKEKKFQQAKAVLNQIDLVDYNRDVKITLCLLHYAQNDFEAVLRILANLIDQNKHDIEAILFRDNVLRKQTEYAKAETLLWDALSNNPDEGVIVARILDIHRRSNNVSALRKIEDVLNPENEETVLRFVPVRVKYALWLFQTDTGDDKLRKKAISILKTNERLLPFHNDTLTALGLIYQKSLRSKSNLDEARSYYELALKSPEIKNKFRIALRLVEVYQSLNRPKYWKRANKLLHQLKNEGLQYSIIDIEIFKCHSYFNDYQTTTILRAGLEKQGYSSDQIQEWRGEVLHFKNIFLLNEVKRCSVKQARSSKVQLVKLALCLEDLYFSYETRQTFLKKEILEILALCNKRNYRDPILASLQLLAIGAIHSKSLSAEDNVVANFKNLEKLYLTFADSADVALTMSFILLKSYHKRLALHVLERLVLNKYTPDQKVRICLQKLHLYKLFGARNEIEKMLMALRHYSGQRTYNYFLRTRIDVAITDDNKPLTFFSIWDKGWVYPKSGVVKSEGKRHTIDPVSLKLVKNYGEGEPVFFSRPLQQGSKFVTNVERRFDTKSMSNYSRYIRIKPSQLYSIPGWVSKILGFSVTEYAESELKRMLKSE